MATICNCKQTLTASRSIVPASPSQQTPLLLVHSVNASASAARARSTRGIPWLYRALANPAWSGGLFNALTQPAVIRYFLERTWGSRQIDEGLYRYDLLTTRQPGAKHAPLYFLGAFLFSNDINTLYEAVDCRSGVHGNPGRFH